MAFLNARKPLCAVSRGKRANVLKCACGAYFSRLGKYPFFEVPLSQDLRADVVMIDSNLSGLSIIEVKSCFMDFERDKKYQKYFDFCSHFYFASDSETIQRIRKQIEDKYPFIGFLTCDVGESISAFSLQCLKEAKEIPQKESTLKTVARMLKSNCLFVCGAFRGSRKLDASVFDPESLIYKTK